MHRSHRAWTVAYTNENVLQTTSYIPLHEVRATSVAAGARDDTRSPLKAFASRGDPICITLSRGRTLSMGFAHAPYAGTTINAAGRAARHGHREQGQHGTSQRCGVRAGLNTSSLVSETSPTRHSLCPRSDEGRRKRTSLHHPASLRRPRTRAHARRANGGVQRLGPDGPARRPRPACPTKLLRAATPTKNFRLRGDNESTTYARRRRAAGGLWTRPRTFSRARAPSMAPAHGPHLPCAELAGLTFGWRRPSLGPAVPMPGPRWGPTTRWRMMP
ncbi:hypothetical protein C8Q79DRAFT_539852 [Trametes meyenii]|nr:hypothetical protein C8Q79DRAFT_539852 [Trametes meyenii]